MVRHQAALSHHRLPPQTPAELQAVPAPSHYRHTLHNIIYSNPLSRATIVIVCSVSCSETHLKHSLYFTTANEVTIFGPVFIPCRQHNAELKTAQVCSGRSSPIGLNPCPLWCTASSDLYPRSLDPRSNAHEVSRTTRRVASAYRTGQRSPKCPNPINSNDP